jgi:tRNA modification GTPase
VRRARDRAASADLVLWLTDSDGNADFPIEIAREGAISVWRVRNKTDLLGAKSDAANPRHFEANLGQGASGSLFRISAARGDGVEDLLGALTAFAGTWFGAGEAAAITRLRHRNILQHAATSLAKAGLLEGQDVELIAEELRISVHLLGRLLGRVDIEAVVDSIFREFCIGK